MEVEVDVILNFISFLRIKKGFFKMMDGWYYIDLAD